MLNTALMAFGEGFEFFNKKLPEYCRLLNTTCVRVLSCQITTEILEINLTEQTVAFVVQNIKHMFVRSGLT